jgi:hypothetical protein
MSEEVEKLKPLRIRQWLYPGLGDTISIRLTREPSEAERELVTAAVHAFSRTLAAALAEESSVGAPDHAGLMLALADRLDQMAHTRQAWADDPEIGGKKPGMHWHLRGKRYGYSHAAQMIRAALSTQAEARSEQVDGGEA